jgi:hypothetical protein
MNKVAHSNYNMLVKAVELRIGNSTTTGNELDTFCKSYFGTQFIGVFPRNMKPRFSKTKTQYCIINTDPSHKSGDHWTAVANKGGQLYGYDSFGRDINALLKMKRRKIINTDMTDREQRITQTNCGARCVAWLMLFSKKPIQAMLI